MSRELLTWIRFICGLRPLVIRPSPFGTVSWTIHEQLSPCNTRIFTFWPNQIYQTWTEKHNPSELSRLNNDKTTQSRTANRCNTWNSIASQLSIRPDRKIHIRLLSKCAKSTNKSNHSSDAIHVPLLGVHLDLLRRLKLTQTWAGYFFLL